ncbi:dihydroorotase [uncultured Bacteroides sp.]|uniref:dihydroorotase n=1 Tax=uncultured Bacteroides sp. TaxID=162156 RepID=UPI002AABA7F8|nr:dihydroorotase [uncultured Bacteroides sp.]
MTQTLIKDATIINEGRSFTGSVIIEGDKIAKVIEGAFTPDETYAEVINAKGKYLIPGIIDDHVHFREPGLTHKADIFSESRAAAAGGVTSFMDMPNTQPQTTDFETLNAKFQLGAEKSLVNYSFYFGATNTNSDLLSKLDPHRVCGVKLFMGSSTGNMLVDRRESLLKVFGGTDLIIAAHCEDAAIIAENTRKAKEKYGDDPDMRFHSLIRNTQACYASSALAVELAEKTGARLHVLHISTGIELELFKNAPLSEKKITAEVCVPHIAFCDDMYKQLGTRIKCNPAIKTALDRSVLIDAITENRIDVVATDHAPHLLSEKEGGALRAVSGMPMIQFSLTAMLELATPETFSKEQVVQKMCHAPAELFKINNRGYIREGYQADLVIVNPNTRWTLTKEAVLSKCGWSPLENYSFSNKVERTFVNGHTVYADGQLDDSYRGQELRFR